MKRPVRTAVTVLLLAVALLSVYPLPGNTRGAAPGSGPAAPSGDWIDFRLATPEGHSVSLSEFIGKKAVLLAFWATWCPHCKETVPELKKLDSGPLSDRLKLLAVDFMESGEKVSSFMGKRGIGYTVLLDSGGKVARSYGVLGIPTYVVINRQGKIVYRGYELPANVSRYLE